MYSGYFFLILQFRQIKQMNINKLKVNQEGKKIPFYIFIYILKIRLKIFSETIFFVKSQSFILLF